MTIRRNSFPAAIASRSICRPHRPCSPTYRRSVSSSLRTRKALVHDRVHRRDAGPSACDLDPTQTSVTPDYSLRLPPIKSAVSVPSRKAEQLCQRFLGAAQAKATRGHLARRLLRAARCARYGTLRRHMAALTSISDASATDVYPRSGEGLAVCSPKRQFASEVTLPLRYPDDWPLETKIKGDAESGERLYQIGRIRCAQQD